MKNAVLNEAKCDKAPYCGAKRACPAGAINFIKEGILDGKIQIDKDKCIGCGKCVNACPHSAISMK
ncbi:MAG: 4Fe-4S ferredoxin [Clostridiales bacterium GWB2_37_7]|nr:MAG: 4Fe-4S ferredoxin [Clostridiales bacterium GWB2_37_7]